MKILIIGDDNQVAEFRQKFGDHHDYTIEPDHRLAEKFIATHDCVFDFLIDESPALVEVFKKKEGTFFFNSVKRSLAYLQNQADHELVGSVFGFNGLPTMFNLPKLEVSMLRNQLAELNQVCKKLNTEFLVVEDRVGMVTPRVVCMIINEAYYTVQEGTASREDIDKAMKLGTNYPYGPFEWCKHVGIHQVYEVLEALYEDTHDERYKVSALLKKEFLLSQ